VTIDVALLAMDGISPIHLAIPCTLFGDRHGLDQCFRLTVCAEAPARLTTTVGLRIEVEHGLEVLETARVIVAPGWPEPSIPPSRALIEALRRAADRGATLLGLCFGAYVLGYAGLLDGRDATTHWRCADDFAARFPDARVDATKLYIQSGHIWTSAGVAAGFDCCLEFINRVCGARIANDIARNVVVAPHRPGGQAQFIEAVRPRSPSDQRLAAVMDDIRRDLGASHRIDEVADRLGMTRRTFTRRFRATMGLSFGDWLWSERARMARELLETGGETIEHIAHAAGFGSAAAFRLHFGRRAGLSPSQWRRAFKDGFPGPETRHRHRQVTGPSRVG
jgi:transcriptional regulator GlxA family with amidase domain